ncbi:MAG: hypothetical protein OXG68_03915 [Chloroflexi bacterium]|nr:hypothetical protein [Chloroflexota bacterium]
MGKCKYCGREAGFFSNQHNKCVQKRKSCLDSIGPATTRFLASLSLVTEKDIRDFKQNIVEVTRASFVSKREWRRRVVESWDRAATRAVEKRTFSTRDSKTLVVFAKQFKLENTDGFRRSTWLNLKNRTKCVGLKRIANVIDSFHASALRNTYVNGANLRSEIEQIAKDSFICEDELRRCAVDRWDMAIAEASVREHVLANSVCNLELFAILFQLRKNDKDCDSSWSKLLQLKKRINRDGLKEIATLIDTFHASTRRSTDFKVDALRSEIAKIAYGSFISKVELRRCVIDSWDRAITKAVEKEDLLESTVRKLELFAVQFELADSDKDCRSTWLKLNERIKLESPVWKQKHEKLAAIMVAISTGAPIESDWSKHENPFKLQKSETLVWTFNETCYFEETKVRLSYSHREWGIYYPAKHEYRIIYKDIGTMGLTTKHIYFVGTKEVFCIRFDRIGVFRELQDGVVLTRYAKRARPQQFVTGEEFTHSLVTALARAY